MLFDDVLRHIGEFGTYQSCLYCVLGFVGIATGWQNMGITFFGANMDHWCNIPELQNFTHEDQRNIAIPPDELGKQTYSRCFYYDLNYSSISQEELLNWNRSERISGDVLTKGCESWVYDQSVFVSTVVSQMDLVCGRSNLISIIQTVYMAGFLVGCIVFGQMSDRVGRLPTLIASLIVVIAFGLAATFVPVYAGYVTLRFFVGMGAAGSYTTFFVICMEIIGPKHRMTTGVMVLSWFALGSMTLPGIAFAIRDHVRMQLVCAVSPVLMLLMFIIVPESPRWLVAEGKDEKAIMILEKIARINGTTLPNNLDLSINRKTKTKEELKKEPNFTDLLKTRNLRKTTLIMWLAWLVVSMVFYGLSFGVSGIGGSLFLNSFINSAVQIPANVITFLILDKVGRKWPTVVTIGASGACCLVCIAFIDRPDLTAAMTTFSVLGKFFSSGAFAIIYVYAAELFPTVIRQVGVGSSSMFARVGGLVQPQVARIQDSWGPGAFLVYGALSVIAGALSALLPETLGHKLPETIEDGESFTTRIRKTIPKINENGHIKEQNRDMGKNKVSTRLENSLYEH